MCQRESSSPHKVYVITKCPCFVPQAFSIFTGLGIHNCQMYENACRLMAKQTVALEVLSYHATAQQEETDKLMVRATGWMEI